MAALLHRFALFRCLQKKIWRLHSSTCGQRRARQGYEAVEILATHGSALFQTILHDKMLSEEGLLDISCAVVLQGNLGGVGQIKVLEVNLSAVVVLNGEVDTRGDIQGDSDAVTGFYGFGDEVFGLGVSRAAKTNEVQRKAAAVGDNDFLGHCCTGEDGDGGGHNKRSEKFFHKGSPFFDSIPKPTRG